MLPLCVDQGIGVIPWSPLARGRLARPWGEKTKRSEHRSFGKTLYEHDAGDEKAIVAAVGAGRQGRGRRWRRSRWPGCCRSSR